jgi:hypothetical protein
MQNAGNKMLNIMHALFNEMLHIETTVQVSDPQKALRAQPRLTGTGRNAL